MQRHSLELAALTWNVAEARPEAGAALHRWITDLSRDASLAVFALQARMPAVWLIVCMHVICMHVCCMHVM